MDTNYKAEISKNAARDAEIAAFLAHERIFLGKFPGVIFVDEKAHAKSLAAALSRATGKTIPVVTADLLKADRAQLAARMDARDEDVPAVVATSVWATGIDIPHLQWACLAGAKISAPTGVLQAGGRTLRRPKGWDTCEIINVFDEGRYEAAAQRRNDRLTEAGIEMNDEEFIRLLPSACTTGRPPAARRRRQAQQQAPQISIGATFFTNFVHGSLLIAGILLLGQLMQTCN